MDSKLKGYSIHEKMRKYKIEKHRRKINNAEFEKLRVRNRHFGKQGNKKDLVIISVFG